MVTTAKEFLAWYALGACMEMDVGGLPFVLFCFCFYLGGCLSECGIQ